MKLRDVLGQPKATALLERALATGRLAHALLFQGPVGVGKADAARAVAAALVCERGGSDACGECLSCLKVDRNVHPDFLWVTRLPKSGSGGRGRDEDDSPDDGPEADPGGDVRRDITVDQIREVREHAAFAPREGRCRVFVIDPADRMNANAQNALLKTLEEPPGRSVIVLVTSRPHVLLPTVRSRCFTVRFAAARAADLVPLLESRGFSPEEAMARSGLAGGRPRLALELDLEALRARREEVLAAIESVATGEARALGRLPALATAVVGSTEESLTEGLDLAESLLADSARLAAGAPPSALVHADLGSRLSAVGLRLGPRRASDLVRTLERLRDDLRFSVNKALLAESLLAAIAGAPLPGNP